MSSADRKQQSIVGPAKDTQSGQFNAFVCFESASRGLALPLWGGSLVAGDAGGPEALAEEAAKNSFDEVVESIAKTTGGNVPKRQAEEVVQRAARDFDAFYDMRKCCCSEEATGSVLAITADGKGMVLHERDLREKTRKAAEKRRQKMGKRLSQGGKKNAKRMATVAAVYTTDSLRTGLFMRIMSTNEIIKPSMLTAPFLSQRTQNHMLRTPAILK